MQVFSFVFFAANCCLLATASQCNFPTAGYADCAGAEENYPSGLVSVSVAPGCADRYTRNAYPSADVELVSGPECSPRSYGFPSIVSNLPSYSSVPVESAYCADAAYSPVSYGPERIVSQGYQARPSYTESRASYLAGSIDCGPPPSPTPTKYLSPVALPVREGRLQVLPTPPLPPPTVISNKCVCSKVVEKPQLYQRIIVAQKNERFLKRTYVPRVEKVSYSAKPRC